MGLLPIGINNRIVQWRAKEKQVDVFVNDASGLISIDALDAYFYAKKYPIRSTADLDISIGHSSKDLTNGKFTFNLYTIVTDISVGDYVYEVVLDDKSNNKFTVVQDRFTILNSLDLSYPTPFASLSPDSYTFYPCDLSTRFTIDTGAGAGWTLTMPSWLTATPTIGAGSSSPLIEVNTFGTSIPYAQVIMTNPWGANLSVDVSYYVTSISLDISSFTFTPFNASTYAHITTGSINKWAITNIPSWLTVNPSYGTGDASVLLTADVSVLHSLVQLTADSSYSFTDPTLDVSFNIDFKITPASYIFTPYDLSTYIDISTWSGNYWTMGDYASWLSFDDSIGNGDQRILLTSSVLGSDSSAYFDIITTKTEDVSLAFYYVSDTCLGSGDYGFWQFEDNLLDDSGEGNDLTEMRSGHTEQGDQWYPVTYVNGKIGKAGYYQRDNWYSGPVATPNGMYVRYSLSQTKDSSIIDLFTGFNSWSISIWFKFLKSTAPSAQPTYTYTLFSSHGDGENGVDIKIEGVNNTLGVRRFVWGSLTETTSLYNGNQDLNDGAWHLLVMTCDGSTHNVFFDNNWVTKNMDSSISIASTEVNIGTEYQNVFWIWPGNNVWMGRWPWNGYVDQTRIYNRKLNLGEVAALWNGGAGV
jgi:hypothetical protein